MALTKKYKCMNIGGCKNANEKKVFEIPVGEELVCPVCGAKMLVEVKSIPWVKYACIAGAVVVLVVGAVVLIPRLGDKPHASSAWRWCGYGNGGYAYPDNFRTSSRRYNSQGNFRRTGR